MDNVPSRKPGESTKEVKEAGKKREKPETESARIGEPELREREKLVQLHRSLTEGRQSEENKVLAAKKKLMPIEQSLDESRPPEERTEIQPPRVVSGDDAKPRYEVQYVDNPVLGVTIVGSPVAFRELNYREDFDGHSATCSVLASKSVLEQFGKEISKSELMAYLEERKLFKGNPDGGTGLSLCRKILSDHGVPVTGLRYRDIAQLAQYMEEGRGAIIAVNSGALWPGSPRSDHAPDGGFNHAVVVTGVAYELGTRTIVDGHATGTIVGFYINDSIYDKFGQLIDVSIMKIAWEDCRGWTVVTDDSYDPREAKSDYEQARNKKSILDSRKLEDIPQKSDKLAGYQDIDLSDKSGRVSSKVEKPPLLYHGSSDGTIEELRPLVAISEHSSLVYANPDKATSCAYLARGNGLQMVCHFGERKTACALFHKDRDACLKDDKGGYLYILKNDTFHLVQSNEWGSKDKVKPIEKIYYPSVFDAMLENGVQVYFINNAIDKQIYNSSDHGESIIRNLPSENQRRGINVQEF